MKSFRLSWMGDSVTYKWQSPDGDIVEAFYSWKGDPFKDKKNAVLIDTKLQIEGSPDFIEDAVKFWVKNDARVITENLKLKRNRHIELDDKIYWAGNIVLLQRNMSESQAPHNLKRRFILDAIRKFKKKYKVEPYCVRRWGSLITVIDVIRDPFVEVDG